MIELLKLASSVDGASEGSEYLDFAIQRLFGLRKPIPEYTRSLDAAVSLIPPHWSIHRLSHTHNGRGKFSGWTVELYQATEAMIDASVAAQAATPALAICAAALRAREALRVSGGFATENLEAG
ncbi:MAG: hypothetical protein JO255_09525 [Alphaproteobacteria bacterium]|nr:hypothetical protein [Alphaproteobacteria bacterium]